MKLYLLSIWIKLELSKVTLVIVFWSEGSGGLFLNCFEFLGKRKCDGAVNMGSFDVFL